METIKITVPKISQAEKLMQVAKRRGYTRTAILRRIITQLADELPDVEQFPEESVSILITAVSPKAKQKIQRYCNAIHSSPSEEIKRAIKRFLIQNPQLFDLPE